VANSTPALLSFCRLGFYYYRIRFGFREDTVNDYLCGSDECLNKALDAHLVTLLS